MHLHGQIFLQIHFTLYLCTCFKHKFDGVRVAQWVRSLNLTAHASLSTIRRGFAPSFVNYKKRCTRLAAASDKVYQLLSHGRWFSPSTPTSSTTKTGRHDIAEILLKVALNTKIQIQIHKFDSCSTLSNMFYGSSNVGRELLAMDCQICVWNMYRYCLKWIWRTIWLSKHTLRHSSACWCIILFSSGQNAKYVKQDKQEDLHIINKVILLALGIHDIGAFIGQDMLTLLEHVVSHKLFFGFFVVVFFSFSSISSVFCFLLHPDCLSKKILLGYFTI